MKLLSLVAIAVAFAVAGPAKAQDFPNRAVTLVVPFPAGGIADQGGRVVAKAMSRILGQPVVVDNKPGAGGIVGAEYVVNAKPDGYTLFYGSNTAMVSYPFLHKAPSYQPDKAFTAVHGVSQTPYVIAVRTNASYKTLAELIEFARKNPEKINYFTIGHGSSHHLLIELLQIEAGVKLTQIPYKGGPQGFLDFLGGTIDVMIDFQSGMLPLEQQGKAIALGVASLERLAGMPNTPTFAEQGYKSVVFSPFAVVAAPSATPKPVIDKLAATVAEALKDPEVVKFNVDRGSQMLMLGPEKTKAFLDQERVTMKKLLDAAGIKPE